MEGATRSYELSGTQPAMIPSGYVKIAIENGPVEIVDLPSYKMVDLSIAKC
jgi:hypothetical protein